VTKRQAAFLFVKFVFAVTVLAWLFHKANVRHVLETVASAGRVEIAGGVLLGLGMVVLAGWRWHRWLAIFDIHVRAKSLMCIALIGQFFMMFLPGPTGDDLTRMLYISRLAPGRVGEACTTVLLDRCMGLASVLVLAVVCVPWQWDILSSSSETHWLALVILSGGAAISILGAIFFWVGHPTHLWFEKRLRALPAHSLRDEAARIWGLLCNNKKSIVRIGCAALAQQFLSCVLFYLAGRSIGIHASFFVWLTFVPIVIAANALPITLAGLGVREYLLVLFLGVTAHVDGERALAASFVAFSMILILSLLGGMLYIFYRPKPKSAGIDHEPEAVT
jgi:uncharacterized membrane protein YbhN (UPF0104 family)